MEIARHTPTPYTVHHFVDADSPQDWGLLEIEEFGEQIRDLRDRGCVCEADRVGDATRDFVELACNNHDKLVSALQDLLDWPALSQCADTRVTTARAILDAVEGKV
jgi:hypothetical protein